MKKVRIYVNFSDGGHEYEATTEQGGPENFTWGFDSQLFEDAYFFECPLGKFVADENGLILEHNQGMMGHTGLEIIKEDREKL